MGLGFIRAGIVSTAMLAGLAVPSSQGSLSGTWKHIDTRGEVDLWMLTLANESEYRVTVHSLSTTCTCLELRRPLPAVVEPQQDVYVFAEHDRAASPAPPSVLISSSAGAGESRELRLPDIEFEEGL